MGYYVSLIVSMRREITAGNPLETPLYYCILIAQVTNQRGTR